MTSTRTPETHRHNGLAAGGAESLRSRTDAPLRERGPDEVDRRAVDAIKMICADMVQSANSGHPGGPMSLADFVWILWTRFLRHDPTDPEWPNRDRFVLSGGHTGAIQYAHLGLFGYLPESEWRRFRQLHSLTPGHVEREVPGAETTTGPLGQGFANAVGMAIAEKVLRARYGADVIDHRTFVTLGDGDVQEGISLEAAALAGHLRLGRLIAFFDDNRAQIDGVTDLVTSEDVGGRFLALGWQVLYVDGHDHEQLLSALEAGIANRTRPTLIIGRTVIARGTATREGDYKTHGSPLGEEEIRRTKERLGLPPDERFFVPDALRERVAFIREELDGRGAEWRAAISARPDGAAVLARFPGQPRPALPAELPRWNPGDKVATRNASGAFLQAVGPEEVLIGGAADLGSSVQTSGFGKAAGELQARTPEGRMVHFGVREFGMTAICNGIAAHGGFVPFCGTFLVFSDYMKPAIRLAAVMGLRVVWVLTHDSFWLGEDGPTHQPVEHLSALRAVPGVTVLRPGDANETVEAWRWALQEADGPVALVLTRQNLPVLERPASAPATAIARGGYTLRGEDVPDPDVLLLATGSEVPLVLAAADLLEQRGRRVRVVNLASWELFRRQPADYRASVLPESAPVRLAVEAGASHGWHEWTGPLGAVHGFDRFGLSAPPDVLAKEFGFTPEAVADHAERLVREAPERARALRAATDRFLA